jgi:hypothetical protein
LGQLIAHLETWGNMLLIHTDVAVSLFVSIGGSNPKAKSTRPAYT